MLRILMVADDDGTEQLLRDGLARNGSVADVRRVETGTALCDSIEEFKPDAIVCDFAMGDFDGYAALTIANCLYPQVPFLIMSGSTSPYSALLAMEHGAKGQVDDGDYAALAAFFAGM